MKLTIFKVSLLISLLFQIVVSQTIETQRGINQAILKVIKTDIEDKHFQAASLTTDLETNFKKASDLIEKSNSQAEMARIIGLFLLEINDSRIFLVPGSKNVQYDYDWNLELVGDNVYVKNVETKSDAYAKGVRQGDRIYMLDGYILSRDSFWKVESLYNTLSPQPSVKVLIIKPGGKKYLVDLKAEVISKNILVGFSEIESSDIKIADETTLEENSKPKYYDKVEGLTICRFPSFFSDPIAVSKLLDQAKKSGALILDLRGVGGVAAKSWELGVRLNRGNGTYLPTGARDFFGLIRGATIDQDDGDLRTLKLMTAYFFHRSQPIGELKKAKGNDKLIAEPDAPKPFKGKIAVLVNAETSGAAEVFARLIQIEKRGIVVGDTTAGRFVATNFLIHKNGITFQSPFGLLVPVAEIVMSDGERLNGKGVVPDQMSLPSQSDLVNRQDPSLAKAAELLGFKLSGEEAGEIFLKKN